MGRTRPQKVPTSYSSLRPVESGPTPPRLGASLDELFAPEKSRGFLVQILFHQLGASATLEQRVKALLRNPADISKMHLRTTKEVRVPGDVFTHDKEFSAALAKVTHKYQASSPVLLNDNIMIKQLEGTRLTRVGFQPAQRPEFEKSLLGINTLPHRLAQVALHKANYIFFDIASETLKTGGELQEAVGSFKQASSEELTKSHYVIPLGITGRHKVYNTNPDGSRSMSEAS